MCHCTNRHLLLLHCFEKSSLRLGRSSVDLVRQQQIAEDGSGLERKLALLGIVDVRPSDVSRKQVRRELNTLEITTECVGERVRHQSLR